MGRLVMKYAVEVTHRWTVDIEAESEAEAHMAALAQDEDMQRKYREITANVLGEV
jgi:hypothetical protein